MSLSHLGETRSSRKRDHLLQTPDTFVRTVLPGMQASVAVVHAGPAIGAGFAQYTAEMEPGGTLDAITAQRFVYVLEGSIAVAEARLGGQGFAYLPESSDVCVRAEVVSRVAVIEKPYVDLLKTPAPQLFVGREADIEAKPLGEDPDLLVQSLIPEGLQHDFAVNTMTYQPGASLNQVEVHVMEHGLLMLEGAGIYRLGNSWYPVAAGDFIWMAPYCPQWFGALGKKPAKYLIYKDWNRGPR